MNRRPLRLACGGAAKDIAFPADIPDQPGLRRPFRAPAVIKPRSPGHSGKSRGIQAVQPNAAIARYPGLSSAEEVSLVVGCSDNAVVICDPQARITYINSGF